VTDERDPRGMDGRDRHGETDTVTEELVRYGALTDRHPSPGFADRVMAAIDAEPTPGEGGLAAALAAWSRQLAGPARQSLRMAAVAAVVVLAVGGALVGAQLSGILRQGPSTGSSASPGVTPVFTASPTATPTPTLVPSPPPTEQPAQSPTPEQTSPPTRSPRPSSSEDGGSETPHPTQTPQPSASGSFGDG
jgi:hypothetical protein